MNIEGDAEAVREFERLGVQLVPVVVNGREVFHGWDPEKLAQFVGVAYEEAKPLSPEELVGRLDRILAASQRAIRQVPLQHLDMKAPARDRTVRDLAYHIFRLSLACRDALVEGYFPEAWLQETAPPDLSEPDSIARYGQQTRDRLIECFRQRSSWDEKVETYYGRQTAHQLLERTAWHAAQHLRQLYDLLDRMGVESADALPESCYAGLPLPKALW